MENNKYNEFYSKQPVSELIKELRSYTITGSSSWYLDKGWYEALKIHLTERELSDEERKMVNHILSSDTPTLKNETLTEQLNNSLSFSKKYPALRSISNIIYFIAWAIAALTVVTTLVLFKNLNGEGSWFLPLATFVVGLILFISLLAYSEIIQVFVDIEENTRKAATK